MILNLTKNSVGWLHKFINTLFHVYTMLTYSNIFDLYSLTLIFTSFAVSVKALQTFLILSPHGIHIPFYFFELSKSRMILNSVVVTGNICFSPLLILKLLYHILWLTFNFVLLFSSVILVRFISFKGIFRFFIIFQRCFILTVL